MVFPLSHAFIRLLLVPPSPHPREWLGWFRRRSGPLAQTSTTTSRQTGQPDPAADDNEAWLPEQAISSWIAWIVLMVQVPATLLICPWAQYVISQRLIKKRNTAGARENI